MTTAELPSSPLAGPSWVYLPVPASIAPEASRLVADLMARRGMSEGPEVLVGSSSGGLAPADPAGRGSFATRVGNANGVWTAEGYAALRAKDTLSAHRAVRICKALFEAGPDNLVSMSDLASRTEMTVSQVRSALSKLSIFIDSNRHVYPEYIWPFGWYYGRDINPHRPREFHYVMTSKQWDAWGAA